MSKRYMDFAPRRTNNVVASGVTEASLAPRSSRPSSRGSAAMARQRPAQCARVVSVTPDAAEFNHATRGKSICSQKEGVSPVTVRMKPAHPAMQPRVTVRAPRVESRPVMAEEADGIEDYWAGELGMIEDLGLVEEEKPVQPIDKPKDDRVGFKDGKSPFINTEKLEKRPLSAFRRGDKKKAPMPVKNSYEEQAKKAMEKDDVPTMVVTGTSKGATFSLFFVILLVTILGAAVGFVVYLAFFQ